MTKLEEEMHLAIHGFLPPDDKRFIDPNILDALSGEAKAAAEVAVKHILDAVVNYHQRAQEVLQTTGQLSNCDLDLIHGYTKDWLKKSGITE